MKDYIIEKTSFMTWTVTNLKNGNQYYVRVDFPKQSTEQIFYCTCPYYTRHNRRVICKHIKMVQKLMEK